MKVLFVDNLIPRNLSSLWTVKLSTERTFIIEQIQQYGTGVYTHGYSQPS